MCLYRHMCDKYILSIVCIHLHQDKTIPGYVACTSSRSRLLVGVRRSEQVGRIAAHQVRPIISLSATSRSLWADMVLCVSDFSQPVTAL